MVEKFIEKITNKTAEIAIIGMGYTGIPLALQFVASGFRVIGIDQNEERVAQIAAARSPIGHIGAERLSHALRAGLEVSNKYDRLSEADAILICVPTPVTKNRDPDLSFVLSAAKSTSPFLHSGQLVVLESTTFPGTTVDILKPILEQAGFAVGSDIFLGYSPEREDPGNARYNTASIPKVVSGYSDNCRRAVVALYGAAIEKLVPVSSIGAAEMTKLFENIHRSVNIGLVNEMKIICHKMGLDIFEIIEAAASKPFGFTPYYPGPGVGGHCIPVDPYYLTWKAKEYGVHTHFVELAGEINHAMPAWVAERIGWALNERGKPLKGSRILILGLSYKKDVNDLRESPAVYVIDLLNKAGAVVAYSDPHFPDLPDGVALRKDSGSITLTPENLSAFDCVAILTNHTAFHYDEIRKHAPLIVDTRGVYRVADSKIVTA